MIKKVLITLFSLTIATGVFLVGFETVFAQQLLPGIMIDGYDMAGQNKTAVSTFLQKKYDSYNSEGVDLVHGDKIHHFSWSELGVSFDTDGTVDHAFTISHANVPGLGTIRTLRRVFDHNTNIVPNVVFDTTALNLAYDKIIYPQFSQAPHDATLNITADSVAVVPAQEGMWVMDDQLTELLKQAAGAHLKTVSVPVTERQADIQAPDLVKAKADAENIMSRDITLAGGARNVVIAKTDLATLFTLKTANDGIHASLDNDKLKTYLHDKVAPKVEQRVTNSVTNPDGSVVTAGKDGLTLKIDDSITLINQALAKDAQKQTVQLAVETKNKSNIIVDPQAGGTAGQFPSKYVEISLSEQRMYLYDGTNFVTSFLVSTGKWSTPTPVGTYAIENKIEVAFSRPFNLYMPKWNAITPDGLYGIHGLPYNNSFHEDPNHIGEARSHGCIRLGPGNDQYVFDWAPIGTPVIIHK